MLSYGLLKTYFIFFCQPCKIYYLYTKNREENSQSKPSRQQNNIRTTQALPSSHFLQKRFLLAWLIFTVVSFLKLFKTLRNSPMDEISQNLEVYKAAWHALWPIFGPWPTYNHILEESFSFGNRGKQHPKLVLISL